MKYLIFSCWLCMFAIQSQAQTKFLQRGFGSSITSSQSDKMVGLHATYPKGTRLLVKNTATGSSVVVKIIGTLANTASNEKLIIRLSQAACKAIHATGKKFSVELYTSPPEEVEPIITKDTIKKNPPEKIEEHVQIHKVNVGETLYSIAKKYKTTVENLMEWNKLENTTLYKGQKIRILKK